MDKNNYTSRPVTLPSSHASVSEANILLQFTKQIGSNGSVAVQQLYNNTNSNNSNDYRTSNEYLFETDSLDTEYTILNKCLKCKKSKIVNNVPAKAADKNGSSSALSMLQRCVPSRLEKVESIMYQCESKGCRYMGAYAEVLWHETKCKLKHSENVRNKDNNSAAATCSTKKNTYKNTGNKKRRKKCTTNIDGYVTSKQFQQKSQANTISGISLLSRPFQCNLCPEVSYSSASGLWYHMKSIHNHKSKRYYKSIKKSATTDHNKRMQKLNNFL
eukprot:g5783.t1